MRRSALRTALALAFLLASPARPQEAASPPVELKEALAAVDLRSPRNDAVERVLTAAKSVVDWPSARDTLAAWFCEQYGGNAARTAGWRRLFGVYLWADLFAAHPEAAESLGAEARGWLLESPRLTDNFFGLLGERDRIPEALDLLKSFRAAEPSRFPKYDSLAVAMALVWDVPPRRVPHHQVAPEQLDGDASSPLEKFRFWVESNERKACDVDLAALGAEDLKFVVDATAPLDELRWAQRAVPFTRGNFERAYSSVRYDQKRLDLGAFSWPHNRYTLENIRKLGGICVDQAYFAAMAGKASGIPTLFFRGEGRRGGHAWFGYLRSDGRWNLDCGRYLYDRFATGTAYDAQRSEEISDHELVFLNEEFRRTPAFAESLAHLRQARVFRAANDSARALSALDAALKVCPMNLDAWKEKSTRIEGGELQAHLKAMLAQFARYPDIKAAVMQQQAEIARQSGDARAAGMIEDQVVRENRAKRHDLSAEVYQRRLADALEKGEWAKGQTIVHEAAMKLRNETGVVFDLLRGFALRAQKAGHEKEALAAIADFRNRMGALDPVLRAQLDALQAAVRGDNPR